MALSGSFYTNVGSHWRLQLEWSATQSIADNQSTVTAKLYWIALDGYGAVYSSQTNTSSVYIEGTWSNESASPALSANQKKLVNTYTKVVTHASDGTCTLDLDGWFDIQVTLGGTYYGRVDLPTKYFTLDTIPRASSLSSSPSWTAGNSLAISISRASSSFTHNVDISVNGRLIKQLTGIGTSTTVNWTVTENTWIFEELNGQATENTLVRVKTYSGGSLLGTKDYTGTVTAPYSSDIGDGFDAYRYTDEDVVVPINRRNSSFTHTVNVSLGSFSKSLTGIGTSATFDWTSTEENSLNAQMPTTTFRDGTLTITTYYNGVQVRSPYSRTIQFHVRNANPTFSVSNISYADTRSTTTTITGNNQVLIQGQSDLTAYVNTGATANKGASMVQYVITLGSAQEILTTTGSKLIGRISAGTNQTLSIKAVDSRGNSTTVSKTVTVVPWEAPKPVFKLERLNKFEDTTTVNVSGSFSPVTISGANKNLIQLVRYRYKVRGSGTWTLDWTNLSHTTSGSTFTVAGFNRTLDNTKSWEFEFSVQDKFGTVTYPIVTVGTGSPIVFIDSTNKSVGIGKFPAGSTYPLDVKGNVYLDGLIEINKISGALPLRMKTSAGNGCYVEMYSNGSTTRSSYFGHSASTDNDFVVYVSDPTAEFQLFVDSATTMRVGRDSKVWFRNEIENESRIIPTLQNGWIRYSTDYPNVTYYKDKFGNVHIDGFVKSGDATNGVILFTLPVGYRPADLKVFITHNSGSYNSTSTHATPTRVDVESDGEVRLRLANPSWTSLCGIYFKADQ